MVNPTIVNPAIVEGFHSKKPHSIRTNLLVVDLDDNYVENLED